MQELDDKAIDELEEIFPTLAAGAFSEARRKALEAGLSIVESEGDTLYEIFPDGTRKFIDKIGTPIHIPVGTKFRIG